MSHHSRNFSHTMYSCSAEKLKWMEDNKTVERAKPVYSSQSEVLQVVNWSTHCKTELPVKKEIENVTD